MSWNVDFEEPEHATMRRKVRDAETVWRGITGSSADQLEVTWTLRTEQGPRGPRPLLHMNVKDQVEGLSLDGKQFAPDEFDNDLHLFNRLSSIWRELLLSGARKHLHRFHEIMSPYAGD